MKARLGYWLFLGMLVCSGWADAARAAGFTFGPAHHLTLARENAGGVAIGDANGDGRADLAVIEDKGVYEHRLALYLQRADGSLASPVTMALPANFGWGRAVTFADMDGDASKEIAVGMYDLIIVELVGGVLETRVQLPSKHACGYLASTDMDADGKTDIVCHSDTGDTAGTIFLGDGAGGIKRRTEWETGSFGMHPADIKSIQVADVTGDGRPDLLVTSSKIDHFFVYSNNGAGGFSMQPVTYPHPRSPTDVWPAALHVIDLDGDGLNEVVTASPENQPDARLNVYRRDASGRLVLHQRIAVYDSPTALASADVDGDGDSELLVAHFGFNAVTLLGAETSGLGNQKRFELPGFGNYYEISRVVGHSKHVAIGDLNGDGCADVVAATYSGVTLLYGCRPPRTSIPRNDFDGDGVSDVIWVDRRWSEFYLWQWADKNAWLQCVNPCPVHRPNPWSLQATGDFDGDGNTDTFWRNLSTGENLAMGAARFARNLTTVSSQDWQVVGVGDFDGDDRSDLFWRNARSGANAIWLSAEHRRQQPTRAVTDLSWSGAGVGEFNGDGRSDVLWRHARTGANATWLSGRFETQQATTGVTDLHWQVQGVGDFNADGSEDVMWRNVATGANTIWLSGRRNTQQSVTGVTNLDWSVVSVGDYNADGYSDLFWRDLRKGKSVIWLSGRWATQQHVVTLGWWFEAIR